MPFSPILQSRCLGRTLTSLTRPDTLSSWNFEDMLDTIEKLLILQDRDRKIRRVRGELTHIEPERQALKAKEKLSGPPRLPLMRRNLSRSNSPRLRLAKSISRKKCPSCWPTARNWPERSMTRRAVVTSGW